MLAGLEGNLLGVSRCCICGLGGHLLNRGRGGVQGGGRGDWVRGRTERLWRVPGAEQCSFRHIFRALIVLLDVLGLECNSFGGRRLGGDEAKDVVGVGGPGGGVEDLHQGAGVHFNSFFTFHCRVERHSLHQGSTIIERR